MPTRFEELPDPFRAEVCLDGAVVGILTDRRFDDMFWRSYALEVREPHVRDAERWNRCAFEFRDPATGRTCRSAFVGGKPPFVSDGRVSVRALYFEKPPWWSFLRHTRRRG
jgi:hypothetical protein